ncbi:hypothetical protein GCM10009677_12570 [Sphaerisporangium rubeum]|uniref:Uncharacterized protein n=1 Tax=Sphaerisporangium rubeum TaxID=321317 RepID=A0A7X0IFW8_9ACTN|nr:hypothetical protein [Sphaerisporangium rubeum]MBB6474421.1 hypothetical protein [Sphaerisporangium rubeum]
MKASYIVTLSVPVADFRTRLADVPGAVFVRELPPSRVVVVVPSPSARHGLSRLPGVTAVQEDRPRRPHEDR